MKSKDNAERDFYLNNVLKEAVGRSLQGARTIIMRDIWAVDMVPPSATLREILTNKAGEEAEFENKADAEIFFKAFFLLYNELSEHQDVDNPFQLFRLPRAKTVDELRIRIGCRREEIEGLLPLLEIGDEISSGGEALVIGLSDALDKCNEQSKGIISEMKIAENVAKISDWEKLMDDMDEIVESIFNQVGQVNQRERKHQLASMIAAQTPLKSEPKVGRNDRCPCGSGRKFKKCCLLTQGEGQQPSQMIGRL